MSWTCNGRGNYLGADDALDNSWDGDGSDSEPCSHCGGEWYLQECDDPIRVLRRILRCDGQWHGARACTACQIGTGLADHATSAATDHLVTDYPIRQKSAHGRS